MKKLLIVSALLFTAAFPVLAVDMAVPPATYAVLASTPVPIVLAVSSYTVSTCPAMGVTQVAAYGTMVTNSSKGVYRVITNNSASTIYRVCNSTMTASTVAIIGTPIYSHEHLIEDRWYGQMYFTADPTATRTCDLRIESIQRQ